MVYWNKANEKWNESRKKNTDSIKMTAFCLTKDELVSRFYIKINNGNIFKQIV